MARNELTMELKVEGLNEAIEKAKQLNELLEKAQSLIDSLSNHKTESEIEIKGTLEKQLQLLKERSENAEDRYISEITDSILEVCTAIRNMNFVPTAKEVNEEMAFKSRGMDGAKSTSV